MQHAAAKLRLDAIELEHRIHVDWLMQHGFLWCVHVETTEKAFGDGTLKVYCKRCGLPDPPPPPFKEFLETPGILSSELQMVPARKKLELIEMAGYER